MKGRYLLFVPIAIVAFTLSVNSTHKPAENSGNGLLFRKIGHELLRSSGDDSSRVMPVKKLSNNHFQIHFERPLGLLSDSIISIVNASLAGSAFPENYTVSVMDCEGKENVYGFAKSAIAVNNIISCQGRALPEGCYYLDIKFTTASTSFSPATWIIIAAILAGIVLFVSIYFHQKNKRVIIPEDEQPAASTDSIQIGLTIFNPEQHYLEFDSVRTELTNKESRLLAVFASSINNMIARDTLQKEVWENEGVIVTRSLDMFVSKLRKKLQEDDRVKIVNFPGKGYMLEVTG